MKSLDEYRKELEQDPKARRSLKKLEKEFKSVEESLTEEELVKYGLKPAEEIVGCGLKSAEPGEELVGCGPKPAEPGEEEGSAGRNAAEAGARAARDVSAAADAKEKKKAAAADAAASGVIDILSGR